MIAFAHLDIGAQTAILLNLEPDTNAVQFYAVHPNGIVEEVGSYKALGLNVIGNIAPEMWYGTSRARTSSALELWKKGIMFFSTTDDKNVLIVFQDGMIEVQDRTQTRKRFSVNVMPLKVYGRLKMVDVEKISEAEGIPKLGLLGAAIMEYLEYRTGSLIEAVSFVEANVAINFGDAWIAFNTFDDFIGGFEEPLIPGFIKRMDAGSHSFSDYTGDGRVDFPDFVQFALSFERRSMAADLNMDGDIGFTDFVVFAKSFMKGT